jgi:hypothetical protein
MSVKITYVNFEGTKQEAIEKFSPLLTALNEASRGKNHALQIRVYKGDGTHREFLLTQDMVNILKKMGGPKKDYITIIDYEQEFRYYPETKKAFLWCRTAHRWDEINLLHGWFRFRLQLLDYYLFGAPVER